MILITGGAGYIGSHVALQLLKQEYDIVIVDSLENGQLETIKTLQSIRKFDFVRADLKNIKDIHKIFEQFSIDQVMHFAAYIRVEESVQNPTKYYQNNFIGSLNLFTSMVAHNVKKLVFSSTAAVYGEPKYVPIDENHPKNPVNPYGFSKFAVEQMLSDFDRAYDLKSVILRYFNVAGADHLGRIGENHVPETHLIPNILRASSETVFKLYGDDYDTPDGTCIRDYVNVEDLANAHLLALNHLNATNKSDWFNVGTKDGNSVKEICKICEKVMGRKVKLEICPRRDGDPVKLVADNSKIEKILGWKPKRSLEDTIRSTYVWEGKKE